MAGSTTCILRPNGNVGQTAIAMTDDRTLDLLFAHLDGNKDNRVCVDDVAGAVRGLPLATAWQLITEMDSTGDGFVPRDQFCSVLSSLVANDATIMPDAFSWVGIYKNFERRPPSPRTDTALNAVTEPTSVRAPTVDKHAELAREISRRRLSKKDSASEESPMSSPTASRHSMSSIEDAPRTSLSKSFMWPPPASAPVPRRRSLVKSASDSSFPTHLGADTLVSVPTYGASKNVSLVVAKRSTSTSPRARSAVSVASLQAQVLETLDAIRVACNSWTDADAGTATKVHLLLRHVDTMLSLKTLPAHIGAALRGFDKSALASVGNRQHATVSIQQVQQATKIRAFRKQVLRQVDPNVPDHVATLTELFPDLLPDTIAQMYGACAQDLQSCFEVLSGLSDYTVLEKQLSPKQATFGKPACFSDSESDDDPLLSPSSSNMESVLAPMQTNTFFAVPATPAPTAAHKTQMTDALKDSLVAAMVRFESSQDFEGIMNGFETVVQGLSIDTSRRRDIAIYPLIKHGLKRLLTFRQSRIFEILDAKQKSHALYKSHAASARRVCIVGAGPVGLRTAIELALLGAQVVVLEKRPSFTRENILHLFPWVVHDLTSLGAKAFYSQFCTSSVYFHVGTRQLQCILLKVALLLGVTVVGNTSFDGVTATDDGYCVNATPALPLHLQHVSAVVGAGGMYDTVGALANIQRIAFSPSPAYGVLGYVANTRTREESQVSEFSWGYQYNQKMFGELKERGLDLENAVYYRGEVHYVVMTPKAKNLLEQGVLKRSNHSPLVHPDNIDATKLRAFVTKAFEFFKIPMQGPLEGANVFDFSRTLRAEKASDVLTNGAAKLYVALVGDALMEPFWPQGLGINRGFLSALDTAYAITQLDTKDDALLLAERESHYKRSAALQLDSNIQKYTIEPTSRYGPL
ncbi:hypothetical protein SDRG_00780 [Saprolegnia diclina VS20]|uniref:EF-hand domain-containing protein n=1 Tax=Saprolegnia diclina (strain VS20) TaxID=1156394 RepID=T0R664_SAPDV|nr:hypothetical protein SDRG_00780 [Saprolegnia diclina VS20]EQC41925.1 hypothetical protein SDRG_00780 [Saprolegnia diclina VS20]|eukprot:XP_008604494.1 hypothetical protein SDRG_00780 [Saprolegnia diclina VS20]